MNIKSCVLTAALLALTVFSNAGNEDKMLYNEPLRPQFHFSAEANRMGNPISLIQIDTVYHLYYQHNPFNLNEGYVNWGHATSTDLLHWENKELAIKQPEQVSDSMFQSPWWGSILQFNNELKAVFNRWDLGFFASTSQTGSNWENEVPFLSPSKNSRCEQHIFKYEKKNVWVMLSFDPESAMISFYNSTDFISWEKTSEIQSSFGLPSLVELPVDRKSDVTKWVLIAGQSNYKIGDFDGKEFKPQTKWLKFDHGDRIDGSICYNDIKKQRVIMTSILRSPQLTDLPTNGQLTFFNEISLRDIPEKGVTLFRTPISEITKLYSKSQEWENKKIYPGLNNNLLSSIKGSEFRIECTIDLKNCDKFGFYLRKNKLTAGADINFTRDQNQFYAFGNNVTVEPIDNKIEFDILIDRSSVEIYINQGKYVISSPFEPEYESLRYELYTAGGEIVVDKMKVHVLNSIWKK